MHLNDDIIELVYSAAVDSAVWPAAIDRLSASFDGIAGGLYVGDLLEKRVDLVTVQGIDSAYVQSYVARYLADENPWAIPSMQQCGYVRTDTALDEYYRSPGFYRGTSLFNEWMKPQDFIYTLGVNLAGTETRQTKLFVYRPERAGPYSEREVARFRRLVRHLTNAVAMAGRVSAATRAADDLMHALDRARFGLVLLDAEASVLEANAFARRLFERRDGLTALRGRLVATHRSGAKALADTLRAARALHAGRYAEAPAARLPRAEERPPLTVMAVPMSASRDPFGVRRAAVALLVTDPLEDARLPIEALQRRYGLTRSEARLAIELVQGRKLREAAERAELTYETARWYIKSAFRKTGAAGQADLVRLLLSDPLLLVREER